MPESLFDYIFRVRSIIKCEFDFWKFFDKLTGDICLHAVDVAFEIVAKSYTDTIFDKVLIIISRVGGYALLDTFFKS